MQSKVEQAVPVTQWMHMFPGIPRGSLALWRGLEAAQHMHMQPQL